MILALLTCLASPAAPASPPCLLCSTGGTPVAQETAPVPVRLEVQTSLDFDKVILTGPTGGMARLAPDGSRLTTGEVEAISPRAMIGELLIRGEPGRVVRVSLPERVTLSGAVGGSLTISRLGSDLPATPRLDANGQLRVRFGGELLVSGEAEGDYRGNIAITVEYL